MFFTWDNEGKWYVIYGNNIPAHRGRFSKYHDLIEYISDRLPILSPIEQSETGESK